MNQVTPCNSSISLYTSIYISRYFVLMNDIQTPIFHPTMHQNNKPVLVPSVQVYHNLRCWSYKNRLPLDSHQLYHWLINKRSKYFQLQFCLKGYHPIAHASKRSLSFSALKGYFKPLFLVSECFFFYFCFLDL